MKRNICISDRVTRNSQPATRNMILKDKKIVVVGLGRTGLAVARFLVGRQAEVVVTDMAAEGALEGQLKMIKDLGIRYELGMHRSETFENADLIVISPGVPHTIEPNWLPVSSIHRLWRSPAQTVKPQRPN